MYELYLCIFLSENIISMYAYVFTYVISEV